MVDGEEGDDEAPVGDDGLEEGEALKLETVLSQVRCITPRDIEQCHIYY